MEAKEALFYRRESDRTCVCSLCPRHCRIAPGTVGFCGVRRNVDGTLHALTYGFPAAIHVDPIEKKPFREFLPGSFALSFGTFGCNLDCAFCQNYELSRGHYEAAELMRRTSPSDLARLAGHYRCASLAFTYNEPTVFYEYMIDAARAAKAAGLSTLLVSNAYIEEAPAKELFPWIDAANFDLKSIRRGFYKRRCGGDLGVVRRVIEQFYRTGRHLELTNLVIPHENDSDEEIHELLDFVETRLSRDVPLHFSAFFPCHRMLNTEPTPPETLFRIRDMAHARGFGHIYLGNI